MDIPYLDVAEKIFRIPSATFCEGFIKAAVVDFLKNKKNTTTREDCFGNLVVSYKYKSKNIQSVCFVGHMDHPGVVVENGEAFLKGGVQESFLKGAKVVFYSKDCSGPLGKGTVLAAEKTGNDLKLRMSEIPASADFGVWDLTSYSVKNGTVTGRACDDLIAVVSMVALVRYLSENRIPADVELWITRAEEVGFLGTFGRLQEKNLDRSRVMISVEASNAKGFAKWGGGVVVRVGDRSSVFHSDVTRWLTSHAEELQKTGDGFQYQRLLMGGGTCEATPIQEAGFLTGAVCLPLQNYHNHGSGGRLAPEKVAQTDWEALLQLMFSVSTSSKTVSVVKKGFMQGLLKRVNFTAEARRLKKS